MKIRHFFHQITFSFHNSAAIDLFIMIGRTFLVILLRRINNNNHYAKFDKGNI